MAYLICYQQRIGNHQHEPENTVIAEDPVDWIIRMEREMPDVRTVILSVFAVTEDQRDKWLNR